MNIKIQEFVCRQNIEKYERLLGTQLSELERKYVRQRLNEELGILASLRPRIISDRAASTSRMLLAIINGGGAVFASIVMGGPTLGL